MTSKAGEEIWAVTPKPQEENVGLAEMWRRNLGYWLWIPSWLLWTHSIAEAERI